MENHNYLLGYRKSFQFNHIYFAPSSKVFPLLGPERQLEWLDDWKYDMIYSDSGLIEKDCIFTTSTNGLTDICVVTQYEIANRQIELLRFSPENYVLKIHISVEDLNEEQSESTITYTYTPLNQKLIDFLEEDMEAFLKQSMTRWEKALNHYLVHVVMEREK